MIKILFLIPGLSEGGAEKVLRNLVSSMDQTKFDITVQTIDEYNPQEYLTDGIHYKAVNRCRTTFGKWLFSYWFRLCAELKLAYRFFVKDDYDIEVAYLETLATKIIAQSTNRRAKKLAWVHCDLSKKEGMAANVDKVREQYRQFDKIVCVSEDARTGFHKLLGTDFDTVVLHNVIDDEEIFAKAKQLITWERNPAETQLLAVGRLTQQKNFAYLIDTCKMLRNDGYKFRLNILGEGPEREALENQIAYLHLEDVVELRGFIGNPYPWMKAADIIVCSSKYEGMSTVIQEAFILGKAVVATPCTGMLELLGNSEYGLIVNPSEDGLYEGIKDLLNHPSKVKYYSLEAKKRSMIFEKKKVIKETEMLLLNELQEK